MADPPRGGSEPAAEPTLPCMTSPSEVAAWMRDLGRTDPQAVEKVEAAVDVLAEYGPTLGKPLIDTLAG
jgi:hypothetical protein